MKYRVPDSPLSFKSLIELTNVLNLNIDDISLIFEEKVLKPRDLSKTSFEYIGDYKEFRLNTKFLKILNAYFTATELSQICERYQKKHKLKQGARGTYVLKLLKSKTITGSIKSFSVFFRALKESEEVKEALRRELELSDLVELH